MGVSIKAMRASAQVNFFAFARTRIIRLMLLAEHVR
jgi:hypothetical protein